MTGVLLAPVIDFSNQKSCVLKESLRPSLTVHGRSNGLGEPGEISMLIEGDAEEMFGG